MSARPIPARTISILSLVALVPSILAVLQLGRIHPDEVYQTLEPAFWKANGYGILAWEWQQGLRNWVIPGLFSWILRLSSAVGIEHPQGYRAAVEVPQFLLHAWALYGAYRYAARRVGKDKALAAAMLVGLWGPALMFAGRTLGESFSADMLFIAVELLDRPESRWRDGVLGGVWIGLAAIARYSSLVFAFAILVWLVLARVFGEPKSAAGNVSVHRTAWGQLASVLAGLLAAAALLAAVDSATWGSPFRSFIQYVRFNVLSGASAQAFGQAPWYFYAAWLPLFLPPWAWPGIPLAVRQERAVPMGLFAAVFYLVAISLTPHKEVRFLYPALALIGFSTAPNFIKWCEDMSWSWVARAAYLAAIALGAVVLLPIDSADSSIARALDQMRAVRGDQFRAIVRAGRGPEVSGLLIVGDGIWGVGGFFYIGKRIPWNRCDSPGEMPFQIALRDRQVNRVVTYDGIGIRELESAGFRVLDRIGHATVLAR